ncbi:MAG: hypothetical protein EOL97_10050 [Spirochaetia bacterium]|nr:hypothetical protein [Spirochaetia bacterium]
MAEEKVIESYKNSLDFVEKQFPRLAGDDKENKILSMTSTSFKTNIGGNSSTYKGIVFGVTEITDSNQYQRDSQLKLYQMTKEKAEAMGDMTMLDELYGKVVNKDNNGNIVALFPYLKNNGEVSAMAGKEIPNAEDSRIRKVYGVCYEDGKNPEENIKVFNLTIKGKALNNIPVFGKIVTFQAGGKEYQGEYQLNSSVTDFVEVEDKYLQEGINAVGADGVLLQFFDRHKIEYSDIVNWKEAYNTDRDNFSIPKEYYSYVVISGNNCMTQNFQPNAKGKCSMTFCNEQFGEDDITLIAGMLPEIADKIEFASNSTCTLLGKLSIFGDEGMPYLTLYGAIPKRDAFISRVNALPIEDDEETPMVEEKVEEKPATKAW